jgi:L-alanine-DL-glutamate epimerase-like enolase superfamily enzyme
MNRPDIESMVERVVNLVKQGYAAVEVKLLQTTREKGLTPETIDIEVKKLKKVIEAVDEKIQIFQDFNQFLAHPKFAINFLNKFRGTLNLWAEQPIYFENLLGLAEIRRNIDIPLVSDESTISPEQVMTMIRLGAADMFNIKLARVGGMYKARKIITMTEAAGLKAKFDFIPTTIIGDTANGILEATVKRESRFPLSCDGHTFFIEHPVKGGIKLSKGIATLPDKPGLGCSLDEEEIEKIKSEPPLHFEA